MESHAVTFHSIQVNVPHLNASQASQYSILVPEGCKAELTYLFGFIPRRLPV